MLSSRFIKPPEHNASGHSSKESFIFRHLDVWYTKMLIWSMQHRKAVVGLSVMVVFSIVPLFKFVGKNFLPQDDQSQYNVLIRTPEGTSLAATTSVTERIAQEIRKLPGVTHTLATVGGGQDKSVNNASVYVKLTDIDQRRLSQQQLMQRTRALLKTFPAEIHTGVELVSSIGGNQSNADVQYFIQGPDLAKLGKYSDELLAKMKTIPSLADADSSLRSGKPELHLDIDRPRAADLGVSVLDIEQALNTLVAGQVASTFNAGDDQYDVRVRAEERFRGGAEGIAKMTVPSAKLGSVPLDQVVRISSGAGPSSINRIARQRQVTLTGNVLPGGSQADILAKLNEFRDQLGMDPDYRSGLTGASKELGRTGFYFMLAFSLTFIFMYIVLAAQFESFIHPITILITLPLAVPFGIVSLLIAGQTVNIFSGLGLLLLFGIVKKNAILQIDHTNGLREQGMNRYDAIIQANRDRLRPILMTTIALVAGMAPLVISHGVGAATNRSIGVLVVGGQTLCLLLTLLAVPVFYSVFEDLGGWATRWIPKRRPKLQEVVAPVVVLALLAGFTPRAVAQTRPEEVPTPPRIGVTGEARLTLPEAIEKVLKNDPDLRVARIAREEAGYGVIAAKGAYDPVVGIGAYRTRAISPVASVLGGSASGKLTQTEINVTPTFSGLSPWGGSYSFKWSNSRQESDNAFVTLNPQYPTVATLNLTQPLWRGLRFDPNRYRIEVAKANQQYTAEQLRQHVIERVTLASNAYWELVYAANNYRVQEEAVRLAEQQFESNRRQVEQGVLAPIDVTAAQTQVANFQQSLFAAQQALTAAENNLKMLMLPDRNDLMWGAAIVPETAPDTSLKVTPLADAVAQALSSRPELSQNAIAMDINKLDVRLNRDQTKPQVNAFANLSATGLSGTVPPLGSSPLSAFFPGGLNPPAIFVGNYGQSLGNLFGGNFPTAQVGVQISLPLRNRTAEAQLATSEAEGRKLKAVRDQIGMAVEADVRNAMQALTSAHARLDAAAVARRSAEDQYASEQRQFQAGTSTVFLVLQRQNELIAARSREVRAKSDVAEAKANLERATGDTIRAQGIEVQ
jgi:hydrophobic/amphiphilic exporter-1 (mainly G- bacteria), HAE1 family